MTKTLTVLVPWYVAQTTALGATGTTAVRSRQLIASGDPGGSGDTAVLHVGVALRTGQGRRHNRKQMGELPARDLRLNRQTAAKMHAQVGSMSPCKGIGNVLSEWSHELDQKQAGTEGCHNFRWNQYSTANSLHLDCKVLY